MFDRILNASLGKYLIGEKNGVNFSRVKLLVG